MYCSACGSQTTPGLSYCNRCGAGLKEKQQSAPISTVAALLTAITVIAMAGLGLMLGGALALRKEGGFDGETIGAYMFMVFLLVLIVEIFLCRMLSKIGSVERRDDMQLSQPHQAVELRGNQPRVLPEPIPSVTENTTRTLQYKESAQR